MPKIPNVLIGAGHGKQANGKFDNGAYHAISDTKEHDLNVDVAVACDAKLRYYGIHTGLDVNIFGRASEPNWSGLVKYLHDSPTVWNLMVEIHHDSPGAKQAGFGILPRTTIFTKLPKLAEMITAEYTRRGLPVKPSYKDVRGLGLLRVQRTPALIWECNATLPTSPQILKARGEAIADGIARWAGVLK
jgi:N-acetylmuramoyl-L-alanine amidase